MLYNNIELGSMRLRILKNMIPAGLIQRISLLVYSISGKNINLFNVKIAM